MRIKSVLLSGMKWFIKTLPFTCLHLGEGSTQDWSHGVHHCNAVRGHKEALQQHNCENNVIGDDNPDMFHIFALLLASLYNYEGSF